MDDIMVHDVVWNLTRNLRLVPFFNTSETLMQYSSPTVDHFLTSCYYNGITRVYHCVFMMIEMPGSLF